MSRLVSVVRHSRLTIGQASPAVVTTAPTPTLNQTADVAPVRPRGVRTIRRHNRIYFGKPATTQLVSEDFYAALNARMDGAYAAVTTEASARLSGDSAVASSVTSLSSSFTTYQGTANGRLTTLEGTTGTLGTRMTAAEASIVTTNAAITSGDAAVASTVTALNSSFTSYQTTANGRLTTLEGSTGTLNTNLGALTTRVTTAESAITSEATTRATADSANASSISSLSSSFTSYQTTNNSAVSAAATAAARIRVFRQSTTPTAGGIGDVWFNTGNQNKPYAWDGSSWVLVDDQQIAAVATVAGRVRVFRQASAPTAGGVGDVWYNTSDSNRPYVWDGSAWVVSDDTRIAAANAAITSEASTRATADSAMASQISSLTANLTTTQVTLADLNPLEAAVTWNFNGTADGWASANATMATQASSLRLTATTADPIFVSPTISITGSTDFIVMARITRVAGSGWEGSCFYTGGTYGQSYSSYKQIANPGLTAGQSAVLTWDMSALTAGGTDWTTHTITSIRLDFGASSADVFDVDWVSIGHRGPGAYNVAIAAANAAITTEQTARVNGDSANATSITNLTSSFNTYKSTNDAALATTNGNLGTTNSNLGALTTRVTTAESAITSEASTRASADSTNATAISSLTSTFGTFQTTTNNRLISRPNLLPNSTFENGLTGWGTNGGDWRSGSNVWGTWAAVGSAAGSSFTSGTAVLDSTQIAAQAGEWYTASADLACFGNAGSYVYIDIIGTNAGGSTTVDGGQNVINTATDFSTSDSNRSVTAVETQMPAGTTNVRVRIVVQGTGITFAGGRMLKLERGRLPYTPYSVEGSIAATQSRITAAEASITSEASTRASADSANASSISSLNSSFTSYQTSNNAALATTNGNLTTANGRLGSLEGRMSSAETSITNEANTRSAADSAEASTRSSLAASIKTQITNLANGVAQKVFKQSYAPGIDQVCPVGVNRLNQSSFNDGVFNYWKQWNTSQAAGDNTLFGATDMNWTVSGSRTLFIHIPGTPAYDTTFGMYNEGNDASPRYTVTPGRKYEFSCYLAQHRCHDMFISIIWYSEPGGVLTYNGEVSSTPTDTLNGGGNYVGAYERHFVIGTAPAGTTQCYVIIRTYCGSGGSAQADPYLMMLRPYFGLAAMDQTEPSPWVDANTSAIWLDTSDNYKMRVWNGLAWELRDDQRIASNAAAITSEASTRASADSALSSTISTVSAASSAAQSTANTGVANAATAQGTANTALANAAAAQATANTATASITTETTARTSSDIDVLRKASQQRVLYQYYGPGVDEFLPYGFNRIMNADGRLQMTERAPSWNNLGYGDVYANPGSAFGSEYMLQGGYTFAVYCTRSPVAGDLYFDLTFTNSYRIPVTAGSYYEASVYLGVHRCSAYITIAWFNSSGTYLGEVGSFSVTGADGVLANNNYAPGLGNYKRAWQIVQAPTGATFCTVYVRAHVDSTSINYPICFATLPYFGICRSGQSAPSDWSNGPDVLLVHSGDSNRLYRWTGQAWALADDARIAATASQTTSLQTTVNGHTASIASQQTSINGLAALATLTVNGGGAVAGYSIYAGGGSSTFRIQAENFEVIGSGGSGAPPFRVSGGVVYINEARIANGAVSEVTAGMAAGYVDLAVTVEAGAKLVFILSVLGGASQPTLQLYDLTGGAAVATVTPAAYSFNSWTGSGGDTSTWYTQTIYLPTTIQWVLTPGYTGYRAFRLRNNTGNLTSGYSTVVMTILQMKK